MPVAFSGRHHTTQPQLRIGETPCCIRVQVPAAPGECEHSTTGAWDRSNDDELVDSSLRGDSTAFSELVRRYYNMCLKRAIFIVRNRSDAEDEVQNAIWKAFQRLVQYRGDGTFSAWLGRIVENQCLMHMREARKSYFVHLDESTDSNVKLELVGGLESPEDEFGGEEVARLVRREISRIPPLLRTVMVLRDVQQLPMPEVALRLGLSIPAAKSRLMRARTELRLRVAKHCGPKGCATLTQRSRYAQTAYCRAS
jgi:RNA polymerase sigma-70 factor, ECF subfamily